MPGQQQHLEHQHSLPAAQGWAKLKAEFSCYEDDHSQAAVANISCQLTVNCQMLEAKPLQQLS